MVDKPANGQPLTGPDERKTTVKFISPVRQHRLFAITPQTAH
jgi:hypothetical protein